MSETKDIQIGVFIPIGNNGWIISENSPTYKPTFELNKEIVVKAEKYGFDFALSMIKMRGYGGVTQHWDYNLESFTLMAGLAAVTKKIQLFASTPVLALPPAVVARMASTIDSIAPGRFGVNIVTGWQTAEYDQMGLWPGNDYFGYRYEYATEYVQVMKDLWSKGSSDFKGKHFTMNDCRLLPMPSEEIKLIAAGQSGPGTTFAAKYCHYNFTSGSGINQPTAFQEANSRLVEAAKTEGRDVGALVLFMIIADETDEAAHAKFEWYNKGTDMEALAWMRNQSGKDVKADNYSTAKRMVQMATNCNGSMSTLIGSYASVASMLDEVASQPIKGVMLTFDDFVKGVEDFGTRIQPLMKSRVNTIKELGI
ncbi:putative pyrimidine monooxygenase RutA-4 [Coleophoma crateriformis]|uniref:Putative pyrimidine monooxygenase RutA-4 n=1 Tax=Coleophoma crateriformis TaxID=565419 RepID=A0A3D8RJJ8_9HELO|nr:putative pyrimidine monooxygenase RutA-4 [Coleophoma crateriformis]